MLLDRLGKLEIASQSDWRCEFYKVNSFFLIFSGHVGLTAR